MTRFLSVRAFAVIGLSALLLAACGSQASTGSASSATPSASPSATAAASSSASASAGSPVVLAQSVGSMGTLLIAASNQMTLYTFGSDTPGVSNCSGQCAQIWPPLTVSAGQTPTGGSGVTGTLATITRSDGSLQVTYKGLPLYFFHNDSKPGDTKGNYPGWSVVHP